MRIWDQEIELIIAKTQHMVTHHKATAMIGIAVDDAKKRDYFVSRLQKVLNENEWARHITFRIVPMTDTYIDLKRELA